MQTQERRKTRRYVQNVPISYFFLNKTESYSAVARNFSRFGMYFETDRPLGTRTMIGIRTLGCGPSHPSGAEGRDDKPPQDHGGGVHPDDNGCMDLKTLVVAEVKRCEKTDAGEGRYGIGVHFMSPAV